MTRDELIKVKAAQIRLLALDSDGVLTDGGVYIDDAGREFRRFDIKDGLGLKRVMEAGIYVAIISSSQSMPVVHRALNLGITEVHIGVQDKLSCLVKICDRLSITLQEVAYMGDDLPDVPILQRVGLACAPSNAIIDVRRLAAFIASCSGGEGAVREISNLLVQKRKQTELTFYGTTDNQQ